MTSRPTAPQPINLQGSTLLVTEFFRYAVNSILFHREVYPSDEFSMVKKYGQTVLVTQNSVLENYLERFLAQVEKWLNTGSVTHLVLVIISKDTRTPLERWLFDIKLLPPQESSKTIAADVQSDRIRAILRQITSSVACLPVLAEPTVFNILAYTKDTADVPSDQWKDSDPFAIEASKSQQVKMRNFKTDAHRVEAMIAYRSEE